MVLGNFFAYPSSRSESRNRTCSICYFAKQITFVHIIDKNRDSVLVEVMNVDDLPKIS